MILKAKRNLRWINYKNLNSQSLISQHSLGWCVEVEHCQKHWARTQKTYIMNYFENNLSASGLWVEHKLYWRQLLLISATLDLRKAHTKLSSSILKYFLPALIGNNLEPKSNGFRKKWCPLSTSLERKTITRYIVGKELKQKPLDFSSQTRSKIITMPASIIFAENDNIAQLSSCWYPNALCLVHIFLKMIVAVMTEHLATK